MLLYITLFDDKHYQFIIILRFNSFDGRYYKIWDLLLPSLSDSTFVNDRYQHIIMGLILYSFIILLIFCDFTFYNDRHYCQSLMIRQTLVNHEWTGNLMDALYQLNAIADQMGHHDISGS